MLDWLSDLLAWLRGRTWIEAVVLSVGLFLVGFFGSIAVVSWFLVRLPATYFQDDHPRTFAWEERHPLVRWSIRIAKNLLGAVLVFIGIILSLPGVPGQGLLTILIGIMLLDFPGKRRLEQSIVRRPLVFRAVNRLRARCGRPPFELDQGIDSKSNAPV